MRSILNSSQEKLIAISEELNAIQMYLELEQMRFKDRFVFTIEIKHEDINELKIAPLLLQPYVENAIIHGFANKEDKGILTVSIDYSIKNMLVCVIEDNGIGREAATVMNAGKYKKHTSLGTRITETRIQIINTLYQSEMEVKYHDLKNSDGKPSGTRVEIFIPIIK